MNLKDFIENNKNKINVITERNTKRNSDGKVQIEANDTWSSENVWDELYDVLKEKHHICK